MKIAACCRAFNEHRHIEKFCQSYQSIADVILIADGGSEDDTVAIAESIPKVKVKNYPVKVQCANGIERNPDGPHIQFLIDWAVEEGADWIIFQDTDMRPNKHLKENGRSLFKMMDSVQKDFLLITQVFLWQNEQYFPNMSRSGNDWAQGLWAWRANIGLKIINKMPHFEFSFDGVTSIDLNRLGREMRVQPPSCYLHFGWEDRAKTLEHAEYYRKSGLIPGMLDPLSIGGTLQPKETWMEE